MLDALKEKKGDPRFLFHDDSQIVRLLVWKIERQEQPGVLFANLKLMGPR